MNVVCPNCGFRHRDEAYAAELLEIRMPNRERQVLTRLIQARGAVVRVSALVIALYGDEIDGGPDGAEATVWSHVSKLRSKLQGSGWDIKARRFEGYRLLPVTP